MNDIPNFAHESRWRPALRWLLAFGFLVLASVPRPGQSAIVHVGDAIGADWVVDNIGAGITLDYVNIPDTNQTRGHLNVTLDHQDMSALHFGLRQTTAAADITTSSASGGLRLLMDVVARDNTNRDWTGYIISTDDRSHVDPTGLNISNHLQDAHFHLGDNFASNPLALLPPTDNFGIETYGLGNPVFQGGTFTVNNILLHERYFANTPRVFDVYFQPVPEPGTLLLIGAALMLVPVVSRRLAAGRRA